MGLKIPLIVPLNILVVVNHTVSRVISLQMNLQVGLIGLMGGWGVGLRAYGSGARAQSLKV